MTIRGRAACAVPLAHGVGRAVGEPDVKRGANTPPGAAALATGVNRGIGLAICKTLAASGFTVFLGARSGGAGAAAAASLARGNGTVEPIQVDATEPLSIEEAFHCLADRGVAITVLVNNAGVYPTGKARHMRG